MVLFTPDFKYKVDCFNLYIIGSYVKRTIGDTANGVTSCVETGSLTVLFLLFYNLITTEDICQPKSNQLNFHYYLCSFETEKLPKITV